MNTFSRILLNVLAAATLLPSLQTTEPWDAPFSGNPKEMVEAARKISAPDDAAIVVLLEEHRFAIDESKHTTSVSRKVFKVLKQDALEEWSSIEQEYEPWHESRPTMRARVIGADNTVHLLDLNTIADSPAQEYDANVFSDRRVLRAPLPAVAPGAIVEYEIVSRESEALPDAGVVRRIVISDYIPIERFRLTIEAAKGVPVQLMTQQIPDSAVRRNVSSGVTRVDCELGPLKVRKAFELNLPPETSSSPYISFSTGRDWQTVASRYEAIVDQQIRAGGSKSMLEGIDLTGSPLAVAARLTARLHKEIRYTGVEFGNAAIVPRTPEEVLKRRYGDCKDKATMLVALLRAAGLKAYVALLESGSGKDIDESLPGFGWFNHAIVYVAGQDPLWIDATAVETRVGELPLSDQGRLALIARRDSPGIVRTPETEAKDNTRTNTIEIHLSDFGPGEVQETLEATGSLETRMRQLYDGNDAKKTKETLERYVKSDFAAKSLGQFTVSKRDDFSERFRLMVQARMAKRAYTTQDEAVAVLFPYVVFQDLPYPLSWSRQAGQELEKTEPRQHDFVFYEPHRIETHYKIFPPAHFKPKALPSSAELKLGPATYTRTYRSNPDGTVDAKFSFTTGKRRISASEFEELREALRKNASETPEIVTFVSEASEYVALGETGKALKLAQQSAAEHPEQAVAQARFSRMLVTAGATEEAIAVARKAVELEPESSQAWQALGWAYQHDSFGRRFRGNWNFDEAVKCYQAARKIDAEDEVPLTDLAILLEHDKYGRRYAKGSRLEEAIALYREILKISPNPMVQQNLAIALLFGGRYQEARDEAKKLPLTDLQSALSVVVTAVTENATRAIVQTQATFPDNRTRALILTAACVTLMQLRQYDRAGELAKATARLGGLTENQARIELLKKWKRYEDALYPPEDPRYPVQQLVLESLSSGLTLPRLKQLFTERSNDELVNSKLVTSLRRANAASVKLESRGFSAENALDLLISRLEVKQLGQDSEGFRIDSVGLDELRLPTMYVVREDGHYRIIGTADEPEKIGELVFNLLEHKNVKTAQWWLDQVVADLPVRDVHGRSGAAVRGLWSGVNEEARGPDAIAVAAASLVGGHSASAKSVQVLKDARARATIQIVKAQLDLALCQSLEAAEKWSELLTVGRRLATMNTFALDGFQFSTTALAKLKEWQELQNEAALWMKADPAAPDAKHAMALALVHTANREAAAEYLKKLTTPGYSSWENQSFEAWNLMLIGKADDSLLTRLSESLEGKFSPTADYWYTIGMLQVILNKPDEASRSLAKALDSDDFTSLDSRPWVIQGKIWERYGIAVAAANAFRKARSSPHSEAMAEWALALAGPETQK